jgi:glycosyltransferase involved in cell wall biosynthesis
VAFIGRNDPAKGLDVFLSALMHFRPDELDVALVGEGVPEAVAQASLSTRRLHVFPRVPEPWETIGPIDLLVLPSRSEGSPNVVIEAFARRVPVVGTGAGGAAELLADNRGVIVPIGDALALAQAIRRALDDPVASAKRAERAQVYALSVHAWDRVVSAWDALLRPYVRR